MRERERERERKKRESKINDKRYNFGQFKVAKLSKQLHFENIRMCLFLILSI
jgi:hypothetical protein